MSRRSNRPARRAAGTASPEFFSRHVRLEQLMLEALRSLLASGTGDEALNAVHPLAVELSEDGGRALVPYAIHGPLEDAAALQREAREALARARGWLRRELAERVAHKRSPELVFRLVGVTGEAP